MLFFFLLASVSPLLVKADCHGNQLMAGNGMIQSEGYPVNYGNNLNCSWTIRASAMEQVILTFSDVMLEDCEFCNCDYVQVLDGPDPSSPVIGTYCGENRRPFSVMSSGEALTVVFVTDASNEEGGLTGFRANYTSISKCGGNYATVNGTITSPADVNNMYPNNADCVYQITVPAMYTIFLKVDRLILQDKSMETGCSDFLEVKETAMGTDLGKYCGEMDRFSVMTSQNTMWLRFSSDNTTTSQGFTVLWDVIENTRYYTNPTGMISSPSFGGMYPFNANITYTITLPAFKQVFLKFSVFDLEPEVVQDVASMPGQNCADLLEIYDSSGRLESYCGLRNPFSILSMNNSITLMFKSNLAINRRGFVAEYETIERNTLFTDYNGLITPPQYQGMYAHNLDSNYTITRPQNEPILLSILNFEVQEPVNGTCLDYLQIGTETICGEQNPKTYIFYGSTTFRFKSDFFLSGAGFQAQYDVCNTTIMEDSGVLRSPGYPAVTYDNITCIYSLRQSQHRTFDIDFTKFDLPPKVNGMCDSYVKITDPHSGDIEVATMEGGQMMKDTMLCGNRAPFKVTVQAREIRITYVSASGNNTIGFNLDFNITDIPTTTTPTTTTTTGTTSTTQAPPTSSTPGVGGPGTNDNTTSASLPIIIAIIVVSVLLFTVAVICIAKSKSSKNDSENLKILSVRRTRQSCAVLNPSYESNEELNRGELK